jgi:hypothetical protein
LLLTLMQGPFCSLGSTGNEQRKAPPWGKRKMKQVLLLKAKVCVGAWTCECQGGTGVNEA